MNTINKHNRYTYDLYHESTTKFENDFRASGYSFSFTWKMRRSLLDYIARSIDMHQLDILDIGCNNGLMGRTFCNSLSRKSIDTNIDGIDFVEEATLIAENSFNYRETFVADITDNNLVYSLLGTKKYQAAICCEVFHYIHPKNYGGLFKMVYSHLFDGGYFVLLLPNVKSIFHGFNKVISHRFKYDFRYEYDLPLIRSLLRENSFNEVSILGTQALTNLKFNLKDSDNKIKRLFSSEFALLSVKK